MKSIWNDKQGSRDRQKLAVLVTADGQIHRFTGRSIDGVCHSSQLSFEKAGKWSNSTFEVLHADTTSFVSWSQDWDTGRAFPQATLDKAFLWLQQQAPLASLDAFKAYVEANHPNTFAEWQERAKAEAQFNSISPADVLAKFEAAKAKAADLQRQQDELDAAERKLASIEADNYRFEQMLAERQRKLDERRQKAEEIARQKAELGNGFSALDKLKF